MLATRLLRGGEVRCHPCSDGVALTRTEPLRLSSSLRAQGTVRQKLLLTRSESKTEKKREEEKKEEKSLNPPPCFRFVLPG